MANQETAKTPTNTTLTSPSLEQQEKQPVLIATGGESMSFLGDFRNTLNQFRGTLHSVQGVVNTGLQIERVFNGGSNRYNNIATERAEAAFANQLTRTAKLIESDSFQRTTPLVQQIWVTRETVSLTRLYSQMNQQSQQMWEESYANVRNSLGAIRSQNNPYNQGQTNPRTSQTAAKAEIAFVTDLQKAYNEMQSPGFAKYSPELKKLWGTREASTAHEKFTAMSLESRQKYAEVFQTFNNKLRSFGVSSSMSASVPTMRYPEGEGLYSSLPPTAYEISLGL